MGKLKKALGLTALTVAAGTVMKKCLEGICYPKTKKKTKKSVKSKKKTKN